MAKSLGGFRQVENDGWERLGGFWMGGFCPLVILNLCVNSYINQISSHVQHTPNPDAQDPPLVPPLLEHSSLKSLIGLI